MRSFCRHLFLITAILSLLFLLADGAQAALVVSNNTVSVTATSATFVAEVVSTNNINPAVMLYLGTTDAGTNATLWPLGFDLGTNAVSLVTNTVYGLRALKDYYWTVSGSTVSGTVWASSTKTFRTALSPPAAPSAVSSLGRISLVPTNDYSASVTFSNTSRGTITLTVITNANISAIVTLENQLRQALINVGIIEGN